MIPTPKDPDDHQRRLEPLAEEEQSARWSRLHHSFCVRGEAEAPAGELSGKGVQKGGAADVPELLIYREHKPLPALFLFTGRALKEITPN
ncbi:hypothetical protein SRHO_G00032030 [Serrasalmus rhombeus]